MCRFCHSFALPLAQEQNHDGTQGNPSLLNAVLVMDIAHCAQMHMLE